MVNVTKTFNPNAPTFRTWPSNTRDMAIQMTINRMVMFRRRGVLNRSKIEYWLLFDSSSCNLLQLSVKVLYTFASIVFPLMRSNFRRIPIALSTLPWDTNHLADSGTTNGVNTANSNGADVTIASSFQSSHQIAIQGKMEAANVKNKAMDMFATNVRHFGPTYSRTERKQANV